MFRPKIRKSRKCRKSGTQIARNCIFLGFAACFCITFRNFQVSSSFILLHFALPCCTIANNTLHCIATPFHFAEPTRCAISFFLQSRFATICFAIKPLRGTDVFSASQAQYIQLQRSASRNNKKNQLPCFSAPIFSSFFSCPIYGLEK